MAAFARAFETSRSTGAKGLVSFDSRSADDSDGFNKEMSTGGWEDSGSK
jgi:hypothetical protein